MLTVKSVENAKSTNKPYKLADSAGLFILIHPNGSKYWRYKYRFAGKENIFSIGKFPEVSLAQAREKRNEAKRLIANHTDPNEVKQNRKIESIFFASNTFELIAREWHTKMSAKWVAKHSDRILSLLVRTMFPNIGSLAFSKLTAANVLNPIQKIEKRGNIETAHRAMQIFGMINRYAIATGRATTDLSLILKGSLTPIKQKHHASITNPKEIGHLLRAIDSYEGTFYTKHALNLAPLVFVRPGELRHAEWSEIDLANSEWKISANKMKMKSAHIVPLSSQAKAILQGMFEHTGNGKYVFPSVRTEDRPLSENTVNAALRRLGYDKDDMTGHGFRSMASTLLHEQGWPHEAIERQLAHSERNKVSAAYNYAEHLPVRREMMQHWADYLDSLRREIAN